MSTQTYYVLGGLALGALLGYHFAPKLLCYQPYLWIHDRVAPASAVSAQIAAGAAEAGTITGASVMAPVQSIVGTAKEVYSEVQQLFQ